MMRKMGCNRICQRVISGEWQSLRTQNLAPSQSLTPQRLHPKFGTASGQTSEGCELLSGSADQSVRLWDLHDGACVGSLLESTAGRNNGDRDAVHSLISKETWLAQVALEVNPLLASGWAIFKSPGGSPRVMLNETFEKAQIEIISILIASLEVSSN